MSEEPTPGSAHLPPLSGAGSCRVDKMVPELPEIPDPCGPQRPPP